MNFLELCNIRASISQSQKKVPMMLSQNRQKYVGDSDSR